MTDNLTSIECFIPHRGDIVLVKSIENKAKENFTIRVLIDDKYIIKDKKGVPSYSIFEMMAQSVAVFNSIHNDSHDQPKVGLLVAIRNFKVEEPYLEIGTNLKIKVSSILMDANTGSFLCHAYMDEEREFASARLTTFVPSVDR